MVNRKLSRILGPILGVMGFMLTVGIMEAPVFAENNVQANSEYLASTAFVENKNYFVNINKSETQNGLKVTVDKAISTKHKLKVLLKVESDKPIDMGHDNSIFEITYGNDNRYGYTSSQDNSIDNKTTFITLEKDNYEGEYPQSGELRVDVVFSNYKVNIGIDIPVDFAESFNNVIEKDISGRIPKFDYKLDKLEADVMGTRITYIEPKRDRNEEEKYSSLYRPVILFKAGDRIYKTNSNGSFMDEDGAEMGNYEVKSFTYDKVKDEKNMSIIPIICDINWEELDQLYEKDKNKKENIIRETISNVSYEKTLNFSDGSKGEVYNIERNDNSIKVYCKGQSEKESLLMASNLEAYYQSKEGENDHSFYDNENVSFYKDSKDTLGYIVEFENVEKDRTVGVDFNNIIKYSDRFRLENEIKLLS